MPRLKAELADLLLFAGVLLARLPYLFPGYGVDGDAWRVVWAARRLALSGAYAPARTPGNPLVEIVDSLVWSGGPLAVNGLTALAGAVAVVAFARLLRRLGSREWLAGALALAFTPVVAIHSADAMDYVWALAFLVAALSAAHDGRPAHAGMRLGLAVGCRLSSAMMLLPLSLVLLDAPGAGGSRARLARLWAAGIAASAVAFSPVLVSSGLGFLHVYQHGYPWGLYVLKNATVEVWGIPGTLALAAALLALARLGRRGPPSAIPPGAGSRAVAGWALAVALVVGLYLWLPHDAAYLVPAVPFVLLLAGRALGSRAFLALCACVALSSFALRASEGGKPNSPAFSALAPRLPGAGARVRLDLLQGPILTDHSRRERGLAYADRVLAAVRQLPDSSVLAGYEWYPVLRVLAGGDQVGRARLVYLLDAASFEAWHARGYRIYYLPEADWPNQQVEGVDLGARGAARLDAGWPSSR